MAVLVAFLVAVGVVTVPTAASAAAGDVGYVGASYSGATNPTADKPQSKLWYHDGRWWANMFDPVSADWHIFSLDRATQKWVDSKVTVDTRPSTSSDTLWDGQYLYIGTHGVRSSSSVSSTTTPMRLYRYSWDATAKKFTLSTGFPKTISNDSSESLTIDKDSSGTVWATWTRVTATGTPGTGQVYLNSGTSNGSTWGTPFVIPSTGGLNNPSTNPNVAADDISALVHFQNKIGVLWSNQKESPSTVYWSVHNDGAPRTTWTGGYAARGSKQADDHLNIKSIQADTSGRVYAAVKTSLDQSSTATPDSPQINLLVFKPGTGAGTWTSTMFGRIRDCHTRPQLMLDEASQRVYLFATGRTGGGTCTSTGAGSIYMKSTSMDNPSFTTGDGTAVMRNAAADSLNNVTTSKQSATAASGLVVLASHEASKRYWHSDVLSGGSQPPAPAAPTAGFTASPQSGTAPLAVQFTDTSTGSPTSWSWNFGDGTTSTVRSPSHTYSAAGTFTATLTASNAGGSSAPVSKTITVTGGTSQPGSGVTVGESAKSVNTATVTTVTVPKPAGVVTGDVLIAQITADGVPSISSAPAGWTAVTAPLSVGTSAKVFPYYRVVSDAATEPTSYQWTLSTAVKWNAAVTNFHGVDRTNPFDTAVSSKVNTTAATTLAVPGVSTTTPGAMLVGGVGPNNAAATVAPPTSWTESIESNGAQTAELAYQPRATPGATGTATWTLNGSYTSAGWLRALRPAA